MKAINFLWISKTSFLTDFKAIFFFLFLCALFFLSTCRPSQSKKHHSTTKLDTSSTNHLVSSVSPKNFKRIIAIGDVATETVIALGDSNKIVAIGRTCPTYPNFQRPKVGYGLTLKAKYILSYKPDLVISSSEASSLEVIREVQKNDIDYLVLEPNLDLNSTKDFILKIAETLQRKSKGEKLIAKIDRQIQEIKKVRGSRKDSLKVMYLLAGGSGLLLMGGFGTGYDEIIRLAGAKNAAWEVEGLHRVTENDMNTLNPDFLLMSQQNYDRFRGKMYTMPVLLVSQAYRLGRVILLDETLLKNPGISIGETALELSRKLYEQQYFQPLLPVNPNNTTPTPERSNELDIIPTEEE